MFYAKKRLSLLIITCTCTFLSQYVLQTTCLENATENRATRLDLSSDVTKNIMRLAKSADIQAMLDTQVDPCNNFYKYACGRWHKHNPAQLSTNLITDRFQMLAHAYERRLASFLDDYANKSHTNDGNDVTGKVRDFYISCQLIGADHISYVLHLENIYKEFANMPVLAGESWQEEQEFNWWQTIAQIQHKYGKQIILAVDIMGNIKNNTSNSIYLGAPSYAIAGDAKLMQQLQETSVVNNLKRYFGVEHKTAEQAAREMIDFELALMRSARNTKLGMELEDILVLRLVDEFDDVEFKGFHVRKFLELVLGNAQLVPDTIYIYDEDYFNKTLQIINSTPKHTVANYILWQLLQEYMLDEKIESLAKKCQDITKKFFSPYLDQAVYATYKSAEVEQDVTNMWEEIRETFRLALKGDKLDWLTNATRSYALEKLDAMRLRFKTYEEVDFASIYANLSIDRLGYVENVRQLLMLQNQERLKKFTEPSVSAETADSATSAYTTVYNLFDNTIYVPVALLQPRFFWDNHYPQAIKYATLGYLIAHEMIHGFDAEGRHHDIYGNQFSWWDEKSAYEFEARRKCFRAQYEAFKGRAKSESISQSENIADNAAIRIAYKTYVRWVNKQLATDVNVELKETLPGVTFNNRQLFFLSFAQLWCVDVQVLFKLSLAAADSHAPSMLRVLASLSNFQEFSWVFKCRADAEMDPKYKCYLY